MTVVFEHIPKTGGSTLAKILRRQYKAHYSMNLLAPLDSLKEFEAFDSEKKGQFELITGHGASLLSSQVERAEVITMLRNPVDRFLSQYDFIKRTPDHRDYQSVHMLTFDEYLDFAVESGQDNLQTRFLSSLLEDSLIGKSTRVQQRHLAEAQEQIDSMKIVLFTGNFDSGLLALKTSLEWKASIIYRKENVRPVMSRERPLSEVDRHKISTIETFDLELYSQALNHTIRSKNQEPGSSGLWNRILVSINQLINQ